MNVKIPARIWFIWICSYSCAFTGERIFILADSIQMNVGRIYLHIIIENDGYPVKIRIPKFISSDWSVLRYCISSSLLQKHKWISKFYRTVFHLLENVYTMFRDIFFFSLYLFVYILFVRLRVYWFYNKLTSSGTSLIFTCWANIYSYRNKEKLFRNLKYISRLLSWIYKS